MRTNSKDTISFFAEVGSQGQRQLAAKFTREGEGYVEEGRQIKSEVASKVCTDLTTYFLKRLSRRYDNQQE